MNLEKVLRDSPRILMDGAILERLRRNSNISLDPDILHAALIYDDSSKIALAQIYTEYFDISRRFNLPLITTAPTFRGGIDRVERSRFSNRAVNRDCVRFVQELKRSHFSDTEILVAGILGPKGDAYDHRQALSESDALAHHALQALELAAGGADLLLGFTIPSINEAIGMARALSAVGTAFGISFLVTASGALQDGTPLNDAIQRVDEIAPPTFFMLNCCHPSVAQAALQSLEGSPSLKRLLGVKANTSAKNPAELEGLPYLDSEEPQVFADALCKLYQQYGIRALGGCCGSEAAHIEVLAHTWNTSTYKSS